MDILGFLLIGLLAGWLANVIVSGSGMGLLGNIVVGIVGALIGGLVFDALDIAVLGNVGRFLVALIGAILLLLLVRAFERPRTEI